jgi:threonylcarbamoyladenosine tRNA methylthiotransferase MtaB
MRVALCTHGCRLNQSETDAMGSMLRAAGHEIVEGPECADVWVLNSCTITHRADADARRAIRRVLRRYEHLKVVVTGCWAQADPTAVAGLVGVDVVLGNADKADLPRHLANLAAPQSAGAPDVAVSALVRGQTFVPLPAGIGRRTRALLKVQDGCNYRCAFCIVPRVRGPSRSLSVGEVTQRLRSLAAQGVPEVVLTGVHLGTYGRDLRPRRSLADLVAALVPALGPARLRISSLDPHEVSRDLIALMAEHPHEICRHLHLPIQSGDETVLRKMRRGHTAADFETLAETLLREIPGIGIGTDVIVGFPGEDEAAFARTEALLAAFPLAYHHVFTYSPRADTAAVLMSGHVDARVKADRNRRLRALSRRQMQAFARSFGGTVLDAVAVPRRGHPGALWAVTDNHLRLALRAPASIARKRVHVRVDVDGNGASLSGP